MRSVVRESWIAFTEPLEGGIPYLYADIRGLVTIAYGNLVDPLSAALSLPLKRPDGADATPGEISTAWLTVKGDPNAARWGHTYARKLTSLRLTAEGMAACALGRLEVNDAQLRRRIEDWEDLPACAQMALHSLAWACGPGFHFPKLLSAVEARDFDAAAGNISVNEWTPEGARNAGLVPRNVANKILMRNAGRVQAYHLDPDLLDWTHDLSVADAPTQPALPADVDPMSTRIVHVDPSAYLRPEEFLAGVSVEDDDGEPD